MYQTFQLLRKVGCWDTGGRTARSCGTGNTCPCAARFCLVKSSRALHTFAPATSRCSCATVSSVYSLNERSGTQTRKLTHAKYTSSKEGSTVSEHEVLREERAFAVAQTQSVALESAIETELHRPQRNLVDVGIKQRRPRALSDVTARTRKLAPRVHLHARADVIEHRCARVHDAPHGVASRDVSFLEFFGRQDVAELLRIEGAHGKRDDGR